MSQLLYRLGRFAARRAWVVLGAWFAVIALFAGLAVSAGAHFSTAMTINGTEAQRTIDLLESKFPDASRGAGQVIFHRTDGRPFTASDTASISAALTSVISLHGVNDAIDPFEAQAKLDKKRAKLADAPQKLADGQRKLDRAQHKIARGRTKLADAKVELSDAVTKLTKGQKKLNQGRRKLLAVQDQVQQQAWQIRNQIERLRDEGGHDAEIAGLETALARVKQGLHAIHVKYVRVLAAQRAIDSGWEKVADGRQKLRDGKHELERGQRKLNRGQRKLDDAKAKIEPAHTIMTAMSEFRTVSADGQTAVATVLFDKPITATEVADKTAVVTALESVATDELEVEFSQDIVRSVAGLLGPGEIVGLIVAAIVLFVMLGSLLAAGLPVLSAILGVAISGAGSVALSAVVESTTTTPILGVMLGLAVGIDYALFILNRHRRQLKAGIEIRESIALANGTSGNSVLFAGLTVIIALVALNLTGIGFLGLMGTVGAAAIAIAVLVAVTFTPAVISLVGMRVLSRRERRVLAEHVERHDAPPVTSSAPVFATKHPILALVSTLLVLGIAAIPATTLRLGLPDGAQESMDSTGYKAYHLTDAAFGEGANATLLVVAHSDAPISEDDEVTYQADVTKLIMTVPDVTASIPGGISPDRHFAVFRIIPSGGPNNPTTADVVRGLRALEPEFRSTLASDASVTGMAAINIDVSKKLGEALPFYLSVVIGLSLIVMILVFRSIALPLIASAGFLATVFATLGAVVAVFQWGWAGWIFDIHDPGPILSFLPTMLIGILFGLAMDYQLFLASGMREAFVHGRNATDSINYGIHLSRAVVTAAAIIMVAVFGGFIFSHTTMIRPMGFGLASGVLIDAFLVRLVLVPAVLKLLGPAAWWLPKWLDRILPDVDVEGARLERAVAEHPHQ